MVEVTESAKAAIDLLTKIEEYDHACDCDDCNSLRTHTLPFVVQAFATHRIEAAKAERDRIVAWLRSDGPDRDNGGPCRHVEHSQGTCICNELADAAIATMFERLREAVKETPSLTVDLIRKENYSGEHREWKEPITFPQNAEFYETVLEAIIAAAFQQENSDGR